MAFWLESPGNACNVWIKTADQTKIMKRWCGGDMKHFICKVSYPYWCVYVCVWERERDMIRIMIMHDNATANDNNNDTKIMSTAT